MTLGIFAKTFVRPAVEEVFDAVAAHGLRCVQFNFGCAGLASMPERIDADIIDRIRRAASARRIVIVALSGTFNMIHPDPRHRRDGLRRLAVLAEACRRLGCGIITLCTGTRDPDNMWRRHPDNDSADAWHDLTESMDQASSIAEANQVTLGIEPEIGSVIDSASWARGLLDELRSPRLKIVMDAANLFHPGDLPRQREILEEAFALIGRDIVLAHAKELGRDGHAGGLPLGRGVLDWDQYLLLLGKTDF